ncbi:MAG TPA: hypothetical protein VEZ90_14915 [Blastocatellia bacterium]|nr:hypothetical protein [Blastocatellia bacterium]
MSKSAKRYAEELSARIAIRRDKIKRLLSEYREAVRFSNDAKPQPTGYKLKKQREMERAVGEYLKLCKAFDRLQRGKAKA